MRLETRARVRWPGGELPAVAGFVTSSFSPLAAEVARLCLSQAEAGRQTAVIIVSASGDAMTAAATTRAVANGRRPGPLLFFQAVPNAVAGHIAAKWDLRGPVVCLSPETPSLEPGLDAARLVIRDGDADEALVILIEQSEVEDVAEAVLVKGVRP